MERLVASALRPSERLTEPSTSSRSPRTAITSKPPSALRLAEEVSTFTTAPGVRGRTIRPRSEEHTSELQSLMRISYAVFCLKKQTSVLTSHYTTITTIMHILRRRLRHY